jgi:hypothetical protein
MPFTDLQNGMNTANQYSEELTKRMQACVNDPISQECL